ncbi:hypothetical protein SAMN05444266_104124 [Chitinophaga jiangningensis]|uniref:Dolichyl-phosphate-mannose-protein mannosyltransferase n=1 Tax=Chitinophaga jiangningensis TaxID=1419482 RepID=A0A1M7BY82_9BACT|nr:hypothetical protein [Chitinophaga jiangningensis]SHL59930.1 hypothetical protein SAMN05444266_104124 [Chitinophaga jiangningensis]
MNLIRLLSHQPLATRDREPFFAFVFRNAANRKYLLAALLLTVIQFVVFKLLYPFPDFISDSSNYVDTNLENLRVNIWPVGYPFFLRLVHLISPSHVWLVAVQYLVLQTALLYLFYSALYLLDLQGWNKRIFFIFLIVNPALLYLANCVLSDALFCAVSVTIFAQYMWMFRSPKLKYLVIQGVLIGIAFTIRYTAIYYPLVALLVIPVTAYKIPLKLLGIVLPWLFILPFIQYTKQETKKITGHAEFSIFGGWQIANNALYMYGHIQVDSTQLPADLRPLDRYAKIYFRKIAPTDQQMADLPGTFFIKMPNAILKPYSFAYGPKFEPSSVGLIKLWGSVSPTYNKYGWYLIKQYPFSFARYYMWLNTKTYFNPHLEKYTNYNLGEKKMWRSPQKWFQLEDPAVFSRIPTWPMLIIGYFYRLLFTGLNFYFLVSLIFLYLGRKHNKGTFVSFASVWLATVFVVINFGFSVFATPVVLRYQFIPLIVMLLFSLHMSELQGEGKGKKAV